MKLKTLSVAVTVALTSLSVSASQEQLNDVDETITVTGSAFNQLVQTEINSETINQKQISDVKELLNAMPSVTVDGNARYSRKVFVRGMEDKFAVVTIDGARQEGQLFHHNGDQTIDPALLKMAEIELGANSVLSGTGAITGSFRYETKDPEDLLQQGESVGARVKTSYETAYERFATNAALYAKVNDKLHLLGIVNYSKDGELHIPNRDDVTSKKGALKSGLTKLIFIPNDNNEFKLAFDHYSDGGNRQFSGEKPGWKYADNDHNYSSMNRDTWTLSHHFDAGSDLINLKTNLYHNRQYMKRDALTEDVNIYPKDSNGKYQKNSDGSYVKIPNGELSIPDREYNVTTIGGDIRNVSWIMDHELTYGVEGYKAKQWIVSGDAIYHGGTKGGQTKQYGMDGGTATAFGVYLQDEFEINKLRVTAGLRYDTYKLGGVFKGSFDQLSPKLKTQYQLTEDLSLRAGYGRLFKGPALPETLTIKAASDVEQADTQAMKGNNYELGFDYDMSNLIHADTALLGFTAYQYDLDNQMHPTKNNTTLANQYDVEVRGVETTLTYSLNDFSLYANHSFSDGDQTSLKTNKTSHLNKTGIHNFKLGGKYQANSEWVFGWDSRFVPGNDYRDEDNEKVSRAGFGVHNIWAQYVPSFAQDLSLNIAVDNMFDKLYAEHTGFGISWGNNDYTSYEAGRNFKASIAYQF